MRKSKKRYRRIDFTNVFLLCLLCLGMAGNLYGQEDVYIDAEDVYVDAPAEEVAQEEPTDKPTVTASEYRSQYHWGINNYGYNEQVYYQFSGKEIFSNGTSPSGMMNMVGWNSLSSLKLKYVPAFSYGLNFQYFTSTSDSVYSGDEETVAGPSIDMQLIALSFSLKAYFMNPLKEILHPFFGLSWGLLSGTFNTTQEAVDGGGKFSTSFMGPLSTRDMGMQIRLSQRAGILAEVRILTCSARTSNDPFDQAPGKDMEINFNGIMINLSGYYRF
ncbi:MAG: hypothetical protein GY866_08440 [Proteobacteria bacterium]|nr:hypothetical protein [Pseudomonadota bacterium]